MNPAKSLKKLMSKTVTARSTQISGWRVVGQISCMTPVWLNIIRRGGEKQHNGIRAKGRETKTNIDRRNANKTMKHNFVCLANEITNIYLQIFLMAIAKSRAKKRIDPTRKTKKRHIFFSLDSYHFFSIPKRNYFVS